MKSFYRAAGEPVNGPEDVIFDLAGVLVNVGKDFFKSRALFLAAGKALAPYSRSGMMVQPLAPAIPGRFSPARPGSRPPGLVWPCLRGYG